MGRGSRKIEFSGDSRSPERSLSALFSQVLVAFTIEFDGEFELRMTQKGYPGAGLSLFVWCNLMRFLVESGISVKELASKALTAKKELVFQLGCLERWGFVELRVDDQLALHEAPHPRTGRLLRDGWGTGRRVRGEWTVYMTAKGRIASENWPPLFEEIEGRWRERFGTSTIQNLRTALAAATNQLEHELPYAVPCGWDETKSFPPRISGGAEKLPLPVLLSQLLTEFALEFGRESRVPLAICANTLRVLTNEPLALAEIPERTGGSRERTAIGWHLKRLVTEVKDPAGRRGTMVKLNDLGLSVQAKYRRLIREIEERWAEKLGAELIEEVRERLQALFEVRDRERLVFTDGLISPQGVTRSGQQSAALGRQKVGAAAKQRRRDMVAQSNAFVRDPAGRLPHFPLWDMNRGFGP